MGPEEEEGKDQKEIPELLDDDGGVGELPPGPVAAVHLLHLGGRAILARALHRRGRRQLIRPRRLHLHCSEIGERGSGALNLDPAGGSSAEAEVEGEGEGENGSAPGRRALVQCVKDEEGRCEFNPWINTRAEGKGITKGN